MSATHYEILGLSSENAPYETVRESYHRLARIHHPDKKLQQLRRREVENQNHDHHHDEDDASKFDRIQKAWETLRDPPSREVYDALLRSVRKGGAAVGDSSQRSDPRQALAHVVPLGSARRGDEEEIIDSDGEGREIVTVDVPYFAVCPRCGSDVEIWASADLGLDLDKIFEEKTGSIAKSGSEEDDGSEGEGSGGRWYYCECYSCSCGIRIEY